MAQQLPPNTLAMEGPAWCSAWSQHAGESPVGTAVAADRFILVELPLPWPADIEMHPLLAECRPADASVSNTRILALGCETGCGDTHTIICYWRDPAEPFAGFHRMERRVARPDLNFTVARWIEGEGLESESGDSRRDVLICTHGSRDRCCGKLGGRLFEDLRRRIPADTRVWRTSHTGGHRFAPTGVSFPEGMAWAGLDIDIAQGIVERQLPVDVALRHLRGCAGFGGGLQQAADGEGFARFGWQWMSMPRTVTVVEDDGSRAALTVEIGDDRAGPFTVTVERGRTLPIALCGQPIADARKTTTELVVVRAPK